MEKYKTKWLLEDAVKVARTSAIKSLRVKYMLNTILVVTTDGRNEKEQEMANEIYDLLKATGFYDK